MREGHSGLLGENQARPIAIKRPGIGLEAYICAMGPHKPPKYPLLYQKQPNKIKPRDLYTSMGYLKQQRAAVELPLSFYIDIKRGKGQKCIFRGQKYHGKSEYKNTQKKIEIDIYFSI
jgi:hypothetical protein